MEWNKIKAIILISLGFGVFMGIIALLPLGKWRDFLVRKFNNLPKTVQNVLTYIFIMIVFMIFLYAWSESTRPIY